MAAACACGSGADDPTDPLRGSIPGAERDAAECARIFACCEATENQLRANYADEAECRTRPSSRPIKQKNPDLALRHGELTHRHPRQGRTPMRRRARVAIVRGLVAFRLPSVRPVLLRREAGPEQHRGALLDGLRHRGILRRDHSRGAPLKGAAAPCAGTAECAVPLVCAAGIAGRRHRAAPRARPTGIARASSPDTNAVCDPKQCDWMREAGCGAEQDSNRRPPPYERNVSSFESLIGNDSHTQTPMSASSALITG